MFLYEYNFSIDGTLNGEPLRFGQSFYISTMDDEGGNVSLQWVHLQYM